MPECALSVPETTAATDSFPPTPPSVAVGGVVVSRCRKRQQLPVHSQLEVPEAAAVLTSQASRKGEKT